MNKMRNSLSLPTLGLATDTSLEISETIRFDDWKALGLEIAKTRGATQWWIGDWWNAGHRYGERKAIVESEDWNGPGFQTCADCGYVATAIETSRRREVLSFKHHREVAALPVEWQETLLDEAEAKELSVLKLRQRVKEVRAFLSQGWTPSQIERRKMVEDGSTVLASMRNNDNQVPIDRALIDWADAVGVLVRIDRQSDWGNPFIEGEDGDREMVIENFGWYLERKPSLESRLLELRGKVLSCWCYPEPCHGDVLIGALGDACNC